MLQYSRATIVSVLLFFAFVFHAYAIPQTHIVDSLNREAYAFRYSDIAYSQHCAQQAYNFSSSYTDGKYEAMNNLAFVAYQQMQFDKANHYANHINRESRNQIELLCADVIAMKVAQRVGDGHHFFDCRNRANHRIARINDDLQFLNGRQLKRFYYACSELHIISSTYYYYLGQDSASISEIEKASDYITLERDTTQWLYYHYMLGSGGLIKGDEFDVKLQEFDHLFKAYTLAKANSILYFEANTLQSIASMLADSTYSSLIQTIRPDAYSYLAAHHLYGDANMAVNIQDSLPLSLAQYSLSLFKRYRDLYQTACTYRTLGEIQFSLHHYSDALDDYLCALQLVESQRSRSSMTVEPWMATIHERLSIAYAALENKYLSDYHRNIYLDLLDSSRQDKELNSRKEILAHEVLGIRFKLGILCLLFIFVLILIAFYYYKLNRKNSSHLTQALNVLDSDPYITIKKKFLQWKQDLDDSIEQTQDEYSVNSHKIDNYKLGNVERRAKVSLVYAIIPYLDRILEEARKMCNKGCGNSDSLLYINELATEIIRLNDILTDWIKMQKGQLNLHITSFSLNKLLRIVALNQHSFHVKGLTLQVDECETRVKADESLTLFMINTLADNARKFTHQGGTVSIHVIEAQDYAEVSIEDSGVGLSPQDVDTLNNSKVYDSSHLGIGQDNKGFGFGIMNCKGIINNYRKISSVFDVCDFGVESEVGKGSRFWFRLPRVLTFILFVCSFSFVSASNDLCRALYDSVFKANIEGRYEEAYAYGDSSLNLMTPPLDTALLISIYNEMAISSLALQHWDDYELNNRTCVHLHQLYSQDPSLASDCARLEKIKSDETMLYVTLVLLSLIAIALFYQLFLKDKITKGRNYRILKGILDDASRVIEQHIEQKDYNILPAISALREDAKLAAGNHHSLHKLVSDFFADVNQHVESITDAEQELSEAKELADKSRFETERLYVMNQILDNSLSTIKHETMYYPSRTQVLTDAMLSGTATPDSLNELYQLVRYYREVYILLYEQASRQLANNNFRRQSIVVSELFSFVERMVKSYNQRNDAAVSFDCEHDETCVLADKVLMDVFIRQMLLINLPNVTGITLSSKQCGNQMQLCFSFLGISKTESELQQLFTPDSERIPYLIMKQIVREHDEQFSHPGLRLYAEPCENGFSIITTLMTTPK